MTPSKIIEENKKRNKEEPYNQITGHGCHGDRVYVEIDDAPYKHLYIPVEMKKFKITKDLLSCGSFKKVYEKYGEKLSDDELRGAWVAFCELRVKYDYEYFAITYQTITDKKTSLPIPFRLNKGQRRVLDSLERMRKTGSPIYIILLKARQWGGSTLIQLYMHWIQTVHRKGWDSVITAHVKDAAITVRSMYDRVIKSMPKYKGHTYKVSNYASTQNIKHVEPSGCNITVGTAQEPESVRSQSPKMAHFSEIGLYPDTEKMKTENLIASIVSAIPMVPLSMVAYESTAQGVGDYFHTQWMAAVKGETSLDPIFVPWFLLDIYKDPITDSYTDHTGRDKVHGNIEDFVRTLNPYELNLFVNNKDCTLEHINWYRWKLKTAASPAVHKQEFPSTPEEAFQGSGRPVFNHDHLSKMRSGCIPPRSIGILTSEVDATMGKAQPEKRKQILEKIKYEECSDSKDIINTRDPKSRIKLENNRLKIWEFPDNEIRVKYRYFVIYDPAKGTSEKADNGVIVVFDRYWRMYGGVSEVVAEMVVREDKDIAVWRAVQIAKYYNNSLLVIESNTFESTDRHDDTEFIFDSIADVYNNLYSRTPADQIREGVPPKYGMHMNRSVKPMVVATYAAYIREGSYVERSNEAIDEGITYEEKKDKTLGAKEGNRDDRLMTRMIGCQIDSEMSIPVLLDYPKSSAPLETINESSF
jgi:hypothetical protein